MADEQEPKTEPEAEPEPRKPEAETGGDGIRDSHGQEGTSKAQYERERREWGGQGGRPPGEARGQGGRR